MKVTRKLVTLAVASLASFNALSGTTAEADTVFYGGTIVTVSDKHPEVTGLAIRNGSIMAVGDQAGILQEYVGANTRLVNLNGRTVMPGFVEPHLHISATALSDYVMLNLSSFELLYDSIDTIISKLRTHIAKLPAGEWVIGFGVDPARTQPFMAELTADDLDKASTTNPIFVFNQSGHIAYVNHKAMEVAGIKEDTPNPGNGGVYVRDAQGKLTGVLNEFPAFAAFAKQMKPTSSEVIVDAYMKTVKNMAATGITTSSEMGLGAFMPVEVEHAMVQKLSHQEDFPIRVRGYYWGTSLNDKVAMVKPNEGDDKFRMIGVKYIADGSTQGLTAALSQPYNYPKGTTNRGALDWEDGKLYNTAKPYFDQGWQISVHSNGDRAIRQALGVYTRLQKGQPNSADRRLRIEHFTTATEKEIDQTQKLRVVPSMTIGHVGFWGEIFHNHLLGPERADRIDPGASLAKRGIRFSYHSDSPVSPFGPLQYISTGATRLWQTPPRQILGPNQRIAVDQAIKAVTLDAAYAMFMEDKAGSLEPGKWADLIILDQNPRSTDPSKIPDIKVLETWVNGKSVFVASERP